MRARAKESEKACKTGYCQALRVETSSEVTLQYERKMMAEVESSFRD